MWRMKTRETLEMMAHLLKLFQQHFLADHLIYAFNFSFCLWKMRLTKSLDGMRRWRTEWDEMDKEPLEGFFSAIFLRQWQNHGPANGNFFSISHGIGTKSTAIERRSLTVAMLIVRDVPNNQPFETRRDTLTEWN